MLKLPIKASLTTSDGFHKCIEIFELKPVLNIVLMKPLNTIAVMESDLFYPSAEIDEQLTFHLEKYREVKTKKQHYIFATYKEI